MIRERYETSKDRDNERKAADKLEEIWGATLYKLPEAYYQVDFFVEKNGVGVGLVEFKQFNSEHDQYPTTISSMGKWAKGVSLSQIFDLPYFLVIKFKDGLFGVQCTTKQNYNVKWFKRKVFRSEGDNEPCVGIPSADLVHYKKMRNWL